jgi:hypothetical protein
MSEGALEQHPIEADPALYNRIVFRDGGFGTARICARPTNRRFLAPLRGRHLARSATIVGPGRGVYLGKGIIITAAHVVTPVARTKPNVRVAGMDLPATAIREGNFERVDLTLLSIDEQKLPIYLQMRRMPLCDNKPWPGEPVIVAIPEGTARSHIMLPSLLPASTKRDFRR